MRFLGIGTLELVMIILVGLLLVGPVDMVRLARRAGTFIRQFKSSELWQSIQGSQRSIKRMGQELISDVDPGLGSIRQELGKIDLTAGADLDELAKMPGWKGGAAITTGAAAAAADAGAGEVDAEPAPSEETEAQA